MQLGELDLLGHHFWDTQVIKAELTWESGLIVSCENRESSCNVSPLGKTSSPPSIIFGYGMILRQIVCNKQDIAPFRWWWFSPPRSVMLRVSTKGVRGIVQISFLVGIK
jgi:hypothetical protein